MLTRLTVPSRISLLVGGVVVAGAAAWQAAGGPQGAAASRGATTPLSATLARLPLGFEENLGQAPAGTRYLARTRGCTVQVEPRGATLSLQPPAASAEDKSPAKTRQARRRETARVGRPSVVRMELLGAQPQPTVTAADRLPGQVNYLLGNDPSAWKTGIHTFAQVRCEDVYPGVDLAYYGNGSQLEYDFVVSPGAEPTGIQMQLSGARALKLDQQGDLLIHTEAGTLRQHRPVAYQEVGGARRPVEAGYTVRGEVVAFTLGEYDRSRALVIDPLLNYSTYLGGSANDAGNAAGTDAAGNAFVVGTTVSANFPLSSAVQGVKSGTTDAFISKLNASGSALLYSTYLGGSGNETGLGIAIDLNGAATVAGETTSANFPTTVGPAYSGNSDAFITRLNGAGQPVFSTLVGGSDTDLANGVAVDGTANTYVVGTTSSANLRGVTTPTFAGLSDAFVTKLDSAGALQYTRLVGGSDFDAGFAIAVADNGEAIIAGDTFSPNLPRVGALQTALHGVADGFVSRLNAAGSALQYSTYLGGADYDRALAVTVDDDGNAYVAGTTYSTDFPAFSGFQTTLRGSSDAYVCKLNAAGNAFVYGTLLGGDDIETAYAITLDSQRKAWVVGETFSPNFPAVGAVQAVYGGGELDGFATRIDANGLALGFSSYLGGEGSDAIYGIAVDSADNAYLVGTTDSAQFPLAAAAQTALQGGTDAFVARVGAGPGTPLAPTNLRATAVPTAISLAWDDNSDNETAFQLERRTGGSEFVLISTQAGTTYTDTNVTPSSIYFYRVRAVNELGSSTYSNQLEVTLTTAAPDAPTGLTASPVGARRIDLHWTDNSDTELIFLIERKEGTGEFEELDQVPADTTDYSDTTVNPVSGQSPTYTYQVTALNALGASDPAVSAPVTFSAGEKAKVSPTKLKFGKVKLLKAKTKTFTIKNMGTKTLQGTVLPPVAPFDIVSGAGPFTLLPKKSIKVTVRIIAGEAESYASTITVLTTDPAHAQVNVQLSAIAK